MAANPPRHFWDAQRSSARKIGKIKSKGTDYTYEDVVWHAWLHICRVYFPDEPAVPGGPCYDIDREPYRGLPPAKPPGHVPDVVVVRCTNVTAVPGAPPVAASERDILWIECKAPCLDQPNNWTTVIGEVVERLKSAHPNRMVYVILAIGLKWMPFIWDPTVPGQQLTNPAGGPLRVLKHNRSDSWGVDPNIYQAPLQNQRHVLTGQGGQLYVDASQAYTLDFWTINPQTQLPRYLADLTLLESCFAQIQQTAFIGGNPPEF